MKILVIDDDAQMRFVVREIMQHHGWEVLEASDGPAGLSQARAHLPDLILCDFEMEGMNGHEILAALNTDATATIPFILITGATERAGFRQTMELGADDYLVKPFDRSQLIRSVEARIARARQFLSKPLNAGGFSRPIPPASAPPPATGNILGYG